MLYLLLLLVFAFANGEESLLVKIPDGLIEGYLSSSYKGRSYAEFRGIPYAKAPIGNLRFEDPVSVEPWEGKWIANQSTECTQVMHYTPEGGVSLGQEDCLHVNVYVPSNKINSNSNYDVIVHIHGGAFMFGSGDMYAGEKYLMDTNVVLVTLNYRVGVFGFLSTEDENLPGNIGMKDQVMALKWIKNNIKYFGGNPDSITITGLSAGGASVHFHLLSPLSRGLFSKAISSSGSSLNAWTIQEHAIEKTRKVAAAVGCNQKCTKELVKCLKTRNAAQLNEATRLLRTFMFNPFSPIGLVVDSASKNPFMPKHPYEILVKGEVYDVPYMISATVDEGLYPAADFASETILEKINKDWDEVAPLIMHYSEVISKEQMNEVSQKIRDFYIGDTDINKENYYQLIQMIGDRIFVADLDLTARLHSKAIKSDLYFYHFNYSAEEVPSVALLFSGSTETYGVCHGDDLMLIFSDTHSPTTAKLTEADEKMVQTMIGIWISFAHTGKPQFVPDWTPVSKNTDDALDYLFIQDSIEMKKSEDFGFRSFWHSLPFEENANLFKTKNVKTEL
ncbi:PREDICTED: venom carboxylesterase-6-like [Nicrophorus vespilloides]|uniref:Carboxylic ester hydrolase n=1 Tax=Nicrophorus vespilloides TaxID=110193 RepID=A0ABM1MQW9_NICVS|nr:PREDICTED: venom carboxylesterase-6-like [Nicrophorus vespilloides]